MLEATARNATDCKTYNQGLSLEADCRGGLLYPIAKNGNEMMWNQLLRYKNGPTGVADTHTSWVIASNGAITKPAQQEGYEEFPYYQTHLKDRDPQLYCRVWTINTEPARRAGEMSGISDFLDPTKRPRRAWSYSPGQRRVKLAPEFAYDTPVASQGGISLFDELQMFAGQQDRFDFKLLGRQEMYIPYNAYKWYFGIEAPEQFMKNHVNPDVERWELHRVYVVEATLKPGMRHVYSKRRYYIDEDTFGAGLYDAWDQNDNLYRTLYMAGVQIYDKDIPYATKLAIFDFNRNMYGILNDFLIGNLTFIEEAPSNAQQNPEAIVGKMTQR